MKTDIETRGRPRNEEFTDFCEQLAADLSPIPEAPCTLVASGSLQTGKLKEYKNFRNSASLASLKKDLTEGGFKSSLYFLDGRVYLKAWRA